MIMKEKTLEDVIGSGDIPTPTPETPTPETPTPVGSDGDWDDKKYDYNDLSDIFWDAFSWSSFSKKNTKYYDDIYHIKNNNYVRDFYIKNYNGYSNKSYTSKYPRSYWDQIKTLWELWYKQYPAKQYSKKLVRDSRDPQEQWLPGGSFRKTTWRVKPIKWH